MIRHHVQKSAADAKRYYAQADYYASSADLRSVFGGKAAERLGIAGPADKEHFGRLCDNLHPLTGTKLTARKNDERIVGIDLTFDGPKGAGVLEALAPPEERRRLREARVAAELETIEEMERSMATRVRSNGRDENRTTGNMLWYRASHDTARPVDGVPDMHPHEHYFCLNATFCEVEKRWKAANLYEILRDMPYYQAAYQQRHAMKLQELGYEIERKGNFFEVAGVPKKVTDKFSRRTKQIEKLAAELQVTDPAKKAELGAASREHKSDHLTEDQLRRVWLSWLTDADKAAVTETHLTAKRRVADGVEPWRAVTPREAMTHAAKHVFERKSSAPARELLAEALTYGVGGFSPAEAWAELGRDGRFTATVDGRPFVAHRDVLNEERRLVNLAARGRGTRAPLNPDHTIEDTRLNVPQRAAVHRLLGSKDFVTMVIGAAGTGKTTLLKEAQRGAKAAGIGIVAVAPSADASRINLRGEGFPEAETVAALLVNEKLQERARGQIVLVDEAAMLGTKQTAELLALAKELGARLWLVGDDKQHHSPGRGSPFELLQIRAGVRPAVVTEVQRQSGRYKELSETARRDPAAAFAAMQAMEWVREVPDAERYQLLADDYAAATSPERRKVDGAWKDVEPSALVVCPTHAEGGRVTAAIRDRLRADGRLGAEREFTRLTNLQLTEAQRADAQNYEPGDVIQFVQNAKGHPRGARVELAEGAPPAHLAARFQAYRPGTIRLAVGDRVRVTSGGQTKQGKRLNTGEVFTVAGFTKSGDLLDARGWVIPKDYGHLAHGYVTTSFGGQSRTVDRVLLAMGTQTRGALDREQFYTDLTRARDWARVYTDDAKALGRAVAREEERVSAVDLASRRKHQRKERGRFTNRVLALRRRAAALAPVPNRQVDRRPVPALETEQTHER